MKTKKPPQLNLKKVFTNLKWGLVSLSGLLFALGMAPVEKKENQPIVLASALGNQPKSFKDSIDAKTGLIVAPGHQLIVKNCLKCHSPQLITAKKASREAWLATIRWMQHSQGLWDLGKEEPLILEYLTKNYAPTYEGRRPNLKEVKWYKLNQK